MLHEDSPHWSGRENLHIVSCYNQPLGITCACGRKLAIRSIGSASSTATWRRRVRLAP